MNINDLSALLKIENGELDVAVKFGFLTVARISEDGGLWYLGGGTHGIGPVSSGGFATKEEAFMHVVNYFKED